MSAFLRNIGQVSVAESAKLGSRLARRRLGGEFLRNIGALRPTVAAAVGAALTCDSADLDGTNDYMQRGGAFTGEAASSQLLCSFWFRVDGGSGAVRRLVFASGALANHVLFRINADSSIQMRVDSALGTASLIADTGATTFADDGTTWHHIVYAADTNFSAGNKIVKIIADGVDVTSNIADGDAAFDIGFNPTTPEWTIGATVAGAAKWNGCLAEVYIAPGQFLDLTSSANVQKFRSSGGKPVNLGADGSTPTGTAPLGYFHLDDAEAAANFATNRGTGGNMTITGTLDTGSSSPSD